MHLYFDESGDFAFPTDRYDVYVQAGLIVPDSFVSKVEHYVGNKNDELGTTELHAAELPAGYAPDELTQIFMSMVSERGYTVTSEAAQAVGAVIERAWERRDGSFGNARLIRNLLEEAILRQSSRLSQSDLAALAPERLSMLEASDIPDVALASR